MVMRSNNDISSELIKEKYLLPPTTEQIFEFISEIGISGAQFERYYRMPFGLLKQIKAGYRSLPVKYWPLFYEKIVPKYGLDYKEINNAIFNKTKVVTKKVTTDPTNAEDNPTDDTESHDRLNRLK